MPRTIRPLTIDELAGLSDLCISVTTNLARSRPSRLTGIPQTNLRRPRRAPQRLRRLAEGADKGAPHPIRVAKPGELRDAFDRLN